jgi:ribonuclease T1
MGVPETPRSDQSRRERPRWAAIAFYMGLLLLVAWLKYSIVDGGPQHPFPSDSPATTPDRPRSTEDRDTRRDDWTPKSRVLRNVPTVEETSDWSLPVPVPPQPVEKSAGAREQNSGRDDALLIRNVRVFDEDRRVVYRGDVDLAPTLKRIESGKRLRFSHDGIVFENRERRLPAKPSGYYREYVQPTPGDNGPGAQRVVLGAEGEVYYSSDHYRSFRRIR